MASSALVSSPRGSRLLILYGSQTGTAQDLAEDLGRKTKRRGFLVSIKAWDSYNINDLPNEDVALMVVSTTGDGEEPDNMKKAWRFLLRKSLPQGSLNRLRFGLFGLGDITYPKFNAVARRLQTRLKQLGAHPFTEIGLGDDQSPRGVIGDFDEWCKMMWPALHQLFPSLVIPPTADESELDRVLFTCSIQRKGENGAPSVEAKEEDPNLQAFYQAPAESRNNSPRPFQARLVVNQRLTPEDWFQETRHLEWDITGFVDPKKEQPTYQAGDVALIYPENPASAVQALLALLGLQEEDSLRISISKEAQGSLDPPFMDLPAECTAGCLFRRYLDIEAVPKRAVLEQLGLLATNPEEKEKLLELASPEGADLYHEYCFREKRSLTEVLEDFPSTRPALDRLLGLIPRIRPRAFSIASSCLPGAHPDRVHLCVAVVRFRTPYKRQRKGLCSSYLASLSVDSTVPMWIRPGSFALPPDPHTPLIMVGPGTGVAPFKAMIEERASQRKALQASPSSSSSATAAATTMNGNGQPHASSLAAANGKEHSPYDYLFFGCRKESVDYYYRSVMEVFSENGQGSLALSTAFSRDVPEGSPRVYVTYRLREASASIWHLLATKNASFFVAGSAKRMPTDVMEAIKSIAQTEGGLNEAEAEKFVVGLVKTRRYCVESWSV